MLAVRVQGFAVLAHARTREPNEQAAGERHRDECAERGMLAVARGVLQRVHAGVFEALQARAPGTPPGTPGPVDLADWDVRTVLRTLRGQVQRAHRPSFAGLA